MAYSHTQGQQSEGELLMRQRWQLPGGLEPKKLPAILIELHFFFLIHVTKYGSCSALFP